MGTTEIAQVLPCIMGPTGAGKTATALKVAEYFSCSVINADSRQVYKDFPLITAQPSLQERQVCPHLLYGFLPCASKITAGEYARMAEKIIADEKAQGRQPLLVGGTGLYFKTLLEGIAPIPPVDESVSQHWISRCDTEGSQALYLLLQEVDPVYAAKIHPNDRQRITRALEVWEGTGQNFSWWHGRPVPQSSYKAVKVGISMPLVQLEPLLAKRIEIMLEQGALDEARSALEDCSNPKAPGWSGIGCREVYAYLTGQMSLGACKELWLKNTRAYAKRQITWFKADTTITWFTPWQTDEAAEFIFQSLKDSI